MAQSDDIGARVRTARNRANLSQQALADAIGVERRVVGYIEQNLGRHPLSVPEARAIAQACEVPIGFIVGSEDRDAVADELAAIRDLIEALRIETADRALEVMRRLDEGLGPREASQ